MLISNVLFLKVPGSMVLVLISYPLGHQRYLDVARFLLPFWFLVTPPSSTAAPLTFRPTPLVSLGGLFLSTIPFSIFNFRLVQNLSPSTSHTYSPRCVTRIHRALLTCDVNTSKIDTYLSRYKQRSSLLCLGSTYVHSRVGRYTGTRASLYMLKRSKNIR